MSEYESIQILFDLVGTIQQFGERLVVQRQMMAFAVVLTVSWLLSYIVWHFLGERVEAWVNQRVTGRVQRHLQYEVSVVHHTMLPTFAIVGLDIVYRAFLSEGWHAGLLAQIELLFWALLIYRLLLGFLYARLGQGTMRRYHVRFIGPLFTILITGWLVDNIIPLTRLADIKIWDGFTNPITLGSLLVATLGFYFWYDGSAVARDVLYYSIVPYTKSDPGTVEAGLTIGRYVVISIGVLVALTVLGFDSTMLAFVTGGLSVGIGFGSQAIISNLISGILLLFDQSLRPGDIISVEGEMGVVKSLGPRATTVNTLNNVEVVIPNQTFLTTTVTTYTKSDRVIRILVPMETANRHSPFLVREALLEAAHKHPHVADEPEPVVYFRAHGDSSHIFNLAVWFDDPTRSWALTSDLYFLIHEACEKRGIEPSTPNRQLEILNAWPFGSNASPNSSQNGHGHSVLGPQAMPKEQSSWRQFTPAQ